jgi:hypothetical protein
LSADFSLFEVGSTLLSVGGSGGSFDRFPVGAADLVDLEETVLSD